MRDAVERSESAILTGLPSALSLAAKLAVSAICLWYLFSKISWTPFAGMVKSIDIAWAVLALGLMLLQLPLIGLRWAEIVRVLAPAVKNAGRGSLLAITSISIFFSQLVPNMFGETIRVLMLARLGVDWRIGLASVLIDRGTGIIGVVMLGCAVCLFPFPLTWLGKHRSDMQLISAAIVIAWTAGLLLADRIGAVLVRYRRTFWLGRFASVTHEALVRSRARTRVLPLALVIHGFSVVAFWALARAEGLPLSMSDVAALLTVVVATAIIPISIGSWGLREVGVTAILGLQGIPLERALFFSVSIGLLSFVATLPGALVWVLYSPKGNRGTG